MRSVAFLAVVAGLAPSPAFAIFIDFRGLASPNNVSGGGIQVSLGSAILKSTATRFGVDSSTVLDVPDLVDSGGSSGEAFSISFSPTVYLDRIVISEFDPDVDAGTFNIKGGTTFTLAEGTNNTGGVVASSSANFLRWTGALTIYGGRRGFSVDGVNIRPVATFSANFDGDADVDGADFLTWQRGRGTGSAASMGNANGDSLINHLDLQVWAAQFGEPLSSVVAPEPGSMIPACALVIFAHGRLRRARQ